MGQYIGARYVPRFMGVYDPTQIYEALDVVDNGLGTSYISRIPTPANTPLTNTTYWKIYGASSGAIINLQNQIDDMQDGTVAGSLQDQINDMQDGTVAGSLQDQINDMQDGTVAGSLQDQINDNASDITALTNDINLMRKPQKIMFVTDSYGNQLGTGSKTLSQLVADKLNITCSKISVSGGSVHAGEIESAVTAYSGDTDYDTIIIVGGANDQSNTDIYSSIKNGMVSLVSAIRAKFTDVKNIIVTCPGMTFNSTYTTRSRIAVAKAYKDGSAAAKAKFVDNSQYILCSTGRLQNDFCHPNLAGVDALAEQIVCFILNGKIDVIIEYNTTDTAGRNYYMYRHNGHTQINIREAGGVMVTKNSAVDGTGATLENFAELTESIVEVNGNLGEDNNNLFGYCTVSNNEERAYGSFYISDKYIKGYVKNKSSASSTTNRFVGNLVFND